MSDPGKGVFNPGPALDDDHAVLVAIVDPAVGVGHVDGGALHARDDRPYAGRSAGVYQYVVGKAENDVHALPGQDVGERGFSVHVVVLRWNCNSLRIIPAIRCMQGGAFRQRIQLASVNVPVPMLLSMGLP